LAEALTKVGLIGVKVWICRGEVYGKRDLAPSFAVTKETGHNRNENAGGNRDRNFKRKKANH
jgi:Ribosomal protein S3